MKVSLVSLNQIWEDKKSNLELCKKYIEKSSLENVDLIVFPEMTLTGFSINTKKIAEKESDSTSVKHFRELAKQNNIAIVFGIVIEETDKSTNRAYFIDSKGEVISIYSKIHPFSFAGEDRYYIGGNTISTCKLQDFNIGLTICYDLRFPELYTSLSKECDAIINIANWPKKRVDHWNTLLKARAIENQIFMFGVNRVGTDGNGLEYIESSNVYNANGETLKEELHYKEMKIYTVNKAWTKQFKESFFTTKDRKIELYKKIL